MEDELANLIDEVPAAREFVRSVLANRDAYRLYESECFQQLNSGVISSTGVDLDGESLPKAYLDNYCEAANNGTVWVTFEHDPRRPPVGRVLAAQVFYEPTRDIYFVAGVTGIYAEAGYQYFDDLGANTNGFDEEPSVTDDVELGAELGLNYFETDIAPFQELVKDAPNEVGREVQYDLRKSFAEWDQITLYVTMALAVFNPFSKAFLSQLGKNAADAATDFSKWVTNNLANTIGERLRQKTLFSVVGGYRDCEVRLIIATNDPASIAQAWSKREGAGRAAMHLIDQLHHLAPERVVYKFDHSKTKEWLPQYLVTKRGIIRDRACLLALDDYTAMLLASQETEPQRDDESRSKPSTESEDS